MAVISPQARLRLARGNRRPAIRTAQVQAPQEFLPTARGRHHLHHLPALPHQDTQHLRLDLAPPVSGRPGSHTDPFSASSACTLMHLSHRRRMPRIGKDWAQTWWQSSISCLHVACTRQQQRRRPRKAGKANTLECEIGTGSSGCSPLLTMRRVSAPRNNDASTKISSRTK